LTCVRDRDCQPREPDAAPLLEAETLDVYAVALEFNMTATVLAARADAVVRDQLRRASLSCVLNMAEGAGRRSPGHQRALYDVARGSALECAAVLDVLRIRGLASATEAARARSFVVRMVQMLTKLDRALR
jgi:four helix bundle protein